MSYNIGTGEVSEYPIKGKWQGFEFIVKSEAFMLIEGSLHKHWHNGINHTDFTFNELCEAVDSLERFTGIDARTMQLSNLEFGLNVPTEQFAENIIKEVICYKNKLPNTPIDNSSGYYTQYKHYDYIVKLYDKAKQYKISDRAILRYELKGVKQRFFADCGVCSLADLKDKRNVSALMDKLLDYFDRFVFDDSSIDVDELNPFDRKVYKRWANPKAWQRLEKGKKQADFASIKRFKEIVKEHGRFHYKSLLKTKLECKAGELLANVSN